MAKKKQQKQRKSVINLQTVDTAKLLGEITGKGDLKQIETQVSAKVVFMDEDGRVLLIREAPEGGTGAFPGRWDVPGGTLRNNETLQDGIIRECIEEVGYNSVKHLPWDSLSSKGFVPQPYVSMADIIKTRMYIPVLFDYPFEVQLGPDFSEYVFVGFQHLITDQFELVPNLKEMIVKIVLDMFDLKLSRRRGAS